MFLLRLSWSFPYALVVVCFKQTQRVSLNSSAFFRVHLSKNSPVANNATFRNGWLTVTLTDQETNVSFSTTRGLGRKKRRPSGGKHERRRASAARWRILSVGQNNVLTAETAAWLTNEQRLRERPRSVPQPHRTAPRSCGHHLLAARPTVKSATASHDTVTVGAVTSYLLVLTALVVLTTV